MNLDLLGLAFGDDGCASTHVDLNGQDVEVEVSFDRGVQRPLLEQLLPRVADLRRLDGDARESLRENLARGDEDDAMPLYRSHHIAELEPETAGRFFCLEGDASGVDETFLRSLRLVRVGIHPESGEIVCDYTIGTEVTNYLVAVTFGPDGMVHDVSMES
jgi:hypothetical protein